MALAVSEINFPLKIPNISKFDKIQSAEIIIHGIRGKLKSSSQFTTDIGWYIHFDAQTKIIYLLGPMQQKSLSNFCHSIHLKKPRNTDLIHIFSANWNQPTMIIFLAGTIFLIRKSIS